MLALLLLACGQFEVTVIDALEEAKVRSTNGNQFCFVWVNYACVSTERQLPGAVHVKVDSFAGSTRPRVVPLHPRAGWMGQEVLAADCCARNLLRAVGQDHLLTPAQPVRQIRGDCGPGG